MEEIRFDDLAALQGRISEDYSGWGPDMEVSQDMINRFADLTGDHQWIHVDVERCRKESPFKGPIAHGFLTLSLLPKLRFLAPVPAGASLHARSRLVSVEAKPKGTMIKQEIQVGMVGQEMPALIYEMIVLYNPPRA